MNNLILIPRELIFIIRDYCDDVYFNSVIGWNEYKKKIHDLITNNIEAKYKFTKSIIGYEPGVLNRDGVFIFPKLFLIFQDKCIFDEVQRLEKIRKRNFVIVWCINTN